MNRREKSAIPNLIGNIIPLARLTNFASGPEPLLIGFANAAVRRSESGLLDLCTQHETKLANVIDFGYPIHQSDRWSIL